MDRIDNKLPGDPAALILAIVSLLVLFLGCCCGLFAILSLTLSIIGLVMAGKALSQFGLQTDHYAVASYKNMNTAKILSIVGIVLSALLLLGQAVFWFNSGAQISRELFEEFQRNGRVDRTWSWDDETATESVENGAAGEIILKKQGDSIVIDSSQTKTQQ